MCPPASSPLGDIGFECGDEELFMFLDKMISGSPLPGNVITYINPYNHAPSNLPPDIWYLLHSKKSDDTGHGFWKVKEEACKLFSNSVITGWRTTLEFFEGRVPHEHKTDWVMQDYWITQTAHSEKIMAKEASSLCRVFLGGEQALGHKKQLIASPHIDSDTSIHLSQSIEPVIPANMSGSSSRPEVYKDDDTANFAATGRPPNLVVSNLPEMDYFSRGDYLELLDLDNPASPSSSSDNSSCLTMSSDEYFDSIALMRYLESESEPGLVQKDKDCRLSVAESLRPDEVVMLPASQGYVSIEGGKPQPEETDSSLKGNGHKDLDLYLSVRNQNASCRDEGPSSNSHAVGTSSGGRVTSSDEEEKAARRRRKKLRKKYLCFMPFYFLF